MKYIRLYWRMLRFHSAVVLIIFLLLGVAWHGVLGNSIIPLILFGGLALVSSYAFATSVNDLADNQIDQVNLEGHQDRPLVTGEANKRDILVVSIISASIALSLGFLANFIVGLLILFSFVINGAYSLPPLRISYRPILTPFYLVLGYVIVPYAIGTVIAGNGFNLSDYLFLPALYFLFLARISLKDFRDREGDSKSGKLTFILTYGKYATCALSLSALLVGSAFLVYALRGNVWFVIGLALYIVALIAIEIRLITNDARSIELVAIGFGARTGNGMLLTLLGLIILQKSGADFSTQVIFYISVAIIYALGFYEFWRRPDTFQFGNKEIALKLFIGRDDPLLVIIGPSGTGKSSVVRSLIRENLIELTPTWTTRPRRFGETGEQIEHKFVSDDELNEYEKSHFFIGVSRAFGLPFRYALPRINRPEKGRVPTIMIRANFALQLEGHFKNYKIYQIEDAPDRIERRLKERQDSGEDLGNRYNNYQLEIEQGRKIADRVFVNDDNLGGLVGRIRGALKTDFLV